MQLTHGHEHDMTSYDHDTMTHGQDMDMDMDMDVTVRFILHRTRMPISCHVPTPDPQMSAPHQHR